MGGSSPYAAAMGGCSAPCALQGLSRGLAMVPTGPFQP